MKKLIRVKLAPLNVVHKACDVLIGRDHTMAHRIMGGGALMAVGVAISKIHIDSLPGFHYFADGVGYMIHGLGAVPLIDLLLAEEAGTVAAAAVFPAIEFPAEAEAAEVVAALGELGTPEA